MTTSPLHHRPAAHGPETGWATARRLRGARTGLHTWVPAVAPPGAAARGGPEGNIVRGED